MATALPIAYVLPFLTLVQPRVLFVKRQLFISLSNQHSDTTVTSRTQYPNRSKRVWYLTNYVSFFCRGVKVFLQSHSDLPIISILFINLLTIPYQFTEKSLFSRHKLCACDNDVSKRVGVTPPLPYGTPIVSIVYSWISRCWGIYIYWKWQFGRSYLLIWVKKFNNFDQRMKIFELQNGNNKNTQNIDNLAIQSSKKDYMFLI